jgi:hypothetical protein
MSGFLKQLAGVFKDLPRDLLDPHSAAMASTPKRRKLA